MKHLVRHCYFQWPGWLPCFVLLRQFSGVVLFWLCCQETAMAQLPFFMRVARQPYNLVPHSGGGGSTKTVADVAKGGADLNFQPAGGTPWVVYSDRVNNNTFRNANGTVPFRKMGFLEAFYVLKERNGYLKLIKYDPKLPIGNKFSSRAVTDRKAVVYYGWAPKARFLLANQSIRSTDQRRAQIFSAVLAQPVLVARPNQYFANDSVKLYSEPTQQTLVGDKMRLYDLTYIYKLSETRRQALIGRASWFPTDSVKQILLGWAPIDVLQSVGNRLFLEPDTTTLQQPSLPLYRSLSAAARKLPDSTVTSNSFPAVSWNQFGTKFPVLNQYRNNKDSQTVVQTNGMTPLLVRRHVPILNVNGQPISSQQLASIRTNNNNYNLIYVIEGSPAMQPYWGEMVNTIQFTISQLSQDSSRSINLRAGAVVYNEYKKTDDNKLRGNVDLSPLTTNYVYLLNELRKLMPPARGQPEPEAKSVRFGVGKALELFAAHPNENNILVLVGINGDMQSIVDGILVPSALKSVECRLLAFQVYSPVGDVANNFVLHARELVLEIANQGSILKKNRLVRPDMVTPSNEFNHRVGDRNEYNLAYPQRSMVPGWVLFPRKNQTLPFKELYAATDSLFRQVSHESETIIDALESTFQHLELLGDRVNPKLTPIYASLGMSLPAVASTLMPLEAYPFLVRAYTPTMRSDGRRWKFIALLPLDEYESISRWLEQLSSEDLDPAGYFDRLRLSRRYHETIREIGLPPETTLTLDQILNGILDLPVANPLFKRITVSQLTNRKQLSDALLSQVLYLLRERRDYFRRIPTFRNSRFTSNGRTYYWISEDLFK
ncbi:type VI secretion system protein TssR domain-containing protein [Spirosoma sp.]|uniref:type VI secretion system protein TssR domain-containing protein n=1 Tax=Spirosoma sp. TaxID=1899569 RepID=UPI002621EC3C|nr:type VI secretion system protein TssR domain-containing protein [Spirosoma sp.]MCX6218236.1 type VI secretion system protein TssR [Spirosoma sp.]